MEKLAKLNIKESKKVNIKKLDIEKLKKQLNVKKKLNEYFFGEEEISLSDGVWFYGVLGFGVSVATAMNIVVTI